MKYFVETRTLMGVVGETVTGDSIRTAAGAGQDWFEMETRSGDVYRVHISVETNFQVLSNIDNLNLDRVPTPDRVPGPEGDGPFDWGKLSHRIYKYVAPSSLIVVRGIYQEQDGSSQPSRYDAKTVYLLDSKAGNFLFETDHWWLTQLERLADGWLDVLFGDKRDYVESDFAELYRTRLNIIGLKTDDQTQEMATLARLIYGLASAALLTGDERFRMAAAAGVKFQRETFRCLDGQTGERCVWAYGKRRNEAERVGKMLFPSQNGDDFNQIPLYEQIYALAGLSQYYRISNDPDVLVDILRTVRSFNYYFKDTRSGHGGYYSHIDYANFSPDSPSLGDNRLKKNWNSVGDHIPAYLVNLLLALDPLPEGQKANPAIQELRSTCIEILEETTTLIAEKFPDPESHFVNERFHEDWKFDQTWRWQQNRAVVGHNLKIAWNLTRAAHYFKRAGNNSQVEKLMTVAHKLGQTMAIYGCDQHRGGCFDAVERAPDRTNGMPYDIVWLPTKDFWQQEQAILAFLVLFGWSRDPMYLTLAREMEAFWNLFFLDRDRWGIFFRTREDGSPVIEGVYGDKGSHSVAGYHAFELNFLAHIYNRVFVPPPGKTGRFCLFFRPSPHLPLGDDGRTTFNVLPDFFAPEFVELEQIQINGIVREPSEDERAHNRVSLRGIDLGREMCVVFRSLVAEPEVTFGFESTASPVERESAPYGQISGRKMRLPVHLPVPDWQQARTSTDRED